MHKTHKKTVARVIRTARLYIFAALCLGTLTLRAHVKDYCTVAHAKSASEDMLLAYGTVAGLTLLHEFGHALAVKCLYGTPFDIHIGGSEEAPALLKLPGVSVRGFNPLQGSIGWGNQPQRRLDRPVARIIHYLAGPIVGASASLLAAYCFAGKCFFKKEHELPMLVSGCILLQNLLSFLPFQGNVDGVEAYKAYRQWRYDKLA